MICNRAHLSVMSSAILGITPEETRQRTGQKTLEKGHKSRENLERKILTRREQGT